MKTKRYIALVCLAAFALFGALSHLGALAVMDISLGINDSLVEPPRGIRPVFAGNVCYVPIEVFTNNFALSYSYDGVSKTLSVSGGRHSLTFNMIQNIATDESLEVYYVTCYYENSTFMVPARVMCEVFGLRYSFLSSINTVRLSLRAASLTDREFTEKYKAELLPKEPEPEKVTAAPPAPAVSAPAAAQVEEEETPEDETPDVYLMYASPQYERLPAVLEALDRSGAKAVFFLSEEYLRDHPESAAEVLASGQEPGIDMSGAADAAGIIAGAVRTADIMARVYKTGVNAVYITSEQYDALSAEDMQAINDAGFTVWRARIRAAGGAASVTERLTGSARTTVLLTDESPVAGIVRFLSDKDAGTLAVRITSRP